MTPEIGDNRAAQIAHRAYADDSSRREACLKLGFLRGEAFDESVRAAGDAPLMTVVSYRYQCLRSYKTISEGDYEDGRLCYPLL
jgi:hypothetical protein